ncbi:NfeD family protein [Paenibacillus darwinianus]|uniref:NfeD family protein n=1 Tax=Paenibacillus darwinianus TaxID=1380763 RepID=UPI000A483A2C|nr:nodulation protein NfeD [Paenibacillus darwinianus]
MRRLRALKLGLLVTALGMLIMATGALASAAGAAEGATTDADKGSDAAGSSGTAVYVVPIRQTVESGLQSFLERAYREAEEADAERIVLVINTLGGRVDTAGDIGDLIRNSKVPTVAFVEGKAISAGTFIALNAEKIVMQPGSTIGAAAVVDGNGELIDNPKTVSYWAGEMRKAAQFHGRDPDVAVAMADPGQRIELKQLGKTKERGEILTLTASEAQKVGYADYVTGTVEETIAWMGLENRTTVEIGPTASERIAGWLTKPEIMFVLFILGIAGIAIELLVPGFGVPGIVGLIAFALYFFGQFVAGFAGLESIVLFVVGVALFILELFVPSFGILGILGVVSLVGGVATAAYDTGSAVLSLTYAFVLAAILAAVVAYVFRRQGIWNKFILRDRLTTEDGYVSADSRPTLAGRQGVALTTLRPSGTIEIGGERIDAVTEGTFIMSGRAVIVSKVEGTRVVVREMVE